MGEGLDLVGALGGGSCGSISLGHGHSCQSARVEWLSTEEYEATGLGPWLFFGGTTHKISICFSRPQ